MKTQAAQLDAFFDTLKRSGSPNNWLVAPADFTVKPDDVAPVFRACVPVLHRMFKAIALQSDGVEVVEESSTGIHIIARTRLMRFKDDIWTLFIPVTPYRSTLALYSASRVGYWDMGTNRRRVETWLADLQHAFDSQSEVEKDVR